ncbi:MAG: DEAD/DEAH box helicase [Alphaproteobacteria bacterium]|nr:DEAD/DEAH box helicase [Alphaproteobacteria bacterium]
MSFKDLGLSEQTIQAINDLGYQEPTTVQKDVIPSILEGKDVFTIAPGACGKTCSYIFPLVDIISRKNGQNILIITPGAKESVNISDKFSVFNKYHAASEPADENNAEENTDNEANVIIATPKLLLENITENNLDVSNVNILVVDDINLIKKNRQLANLEKILDMLPAEKQNIVFTNRRSKETQNTLDKILKTPAEIKIDKNKESEVEGLAQNEPVLPTEPAETAKKPERRKTKPRQENTQDRKALELARRYKVFGKKTPAFLLEDAKAFS